MKKKSILSIISIILLTVFDQLVKFIVDAKMAVGESVDIIKGVFSITYVQNRGAAWGSFYGKRIFLLLLTITILVATVIVYIKMMKYDNFKPLRVCSIILISGALGNIIDRVIHGFVIDMLDFNLIKFPVFNVADIYVTCSIVAILILILFKYKDDDFEVVFNKKKEQS